MTVDATREGLQRMQDDDIRQAVAAGDTSGLADLDLSEEEQAMLVAAADDFPDVEGFAQVDYFLKIPGFQNKANKAFPALRPGGFSTAIRYVGNKA